MAAQWSCIINFMEVVLSKPVNKIDLCADMILASARAFKAGSQIDFVTSILLAGAVNEILEPLLEELGLKRKRGEFALRVARIASKISDDHPIDEKTRKSAFASSKSIYNALKHAGDRNRGIKPSDDLEMIVDLCVEAAESLSFALDNFLALPEPYVTQQKINQVFSDEFLDLFQTLRNEIG